MEQNIKLKINDQEITLNRYVQTVFKNVISGLLESLDKLPEDQKKIEIILTETKTT